MTESIGIAGAFAAGLLGSVHCLGMCGGIAGALGMHARQTTSSTTLRTILLFSYSIGRIGSYALLGALLGLAGAWLGDGATFLTWSNTLRVFTGLILLLIGVQIASGRRPLKFIDAAGARVWRHVAPLARRLSGVRSPGQALLAGAVWGWLPCGLVYTVALLAAAAGSWSLGALTMIAFGLGTLPAMVATGATAAVVQNRLHSADLKTLAGVMLVAFGLWTVVIPVSDFLTSETVDHSQHLEH